MSPPPGSACNTEEVWRLNKALYGLRQAAQAWNTTWTQAMLRLGFQVSVADPCLFHIDFANKGRVFVVLHVDDALVIGNIRG